MRMVITLLFLALGCTTTILGDVATPVAQPPLLDSVSSTYYFDGHYAGNCKYNIEAVSEFNSAKSVHLSLCDSLGYGPLIDIRWFYDGNRPAWQGLSIKPREFRMLFNNETMLEID